MPANANAERHDPRSLHGGSDPVSARALLEGGGGSDGAIFAVDEGVDAEVSKAVCEGAVREATAFPGRSERRVFDDLASGVIVRLCDVFFIILYCLFVYSFIYFSICLFIYFSMYIFIYTTKKAQRGSDKGLLDEVGEVGDGIERFASQKHLRLTRFITHTQSIVARALGLDRSSKCAPRSPSPSSSSQPSSPIATRG